MHGAVGVGEVLHQRPAEESFGLRDRGHDRRDRVAMGLGPGDRSGEHDLAPVVHDIAGAPRPTARGLELEEIHLPHLVAPGGRVQERLTARTGEIADLADVACGQRETGLAKDPQARRLGDLDVVVERAEPRDLFEINETTSPGGRLASTPGSARALPERAGEVVDLGLQRLLPAGRLHAAGGLRQAGLAGLQELVLPLPDRRLRDAMSAGRRPRHSPPEVRLRHELLAGLAVEGLTDAALVEQEHLVADAA